MAVPKKKTSKAKSRSRRASNWRLRRRPAASARSAPGQAAPRGVRQLRLVRRPPGHRRRLIPDAARRRRCDGRRQGARARSSPAPQAAGRPRHPVVLVGRPDLIGDTGGLEVIPAPRSSAWTTTRPRACGARRTRRWCGPPRPCATGGPRRWSAPATPGATMASALLRMGRIKGVSPPGHRHARSRCPGSTPTVLLDAGANAECQPPGSCSSPRWAPPSPPPLRHRRAPGRRCCRSARRRPRAPRS